QHQPGDEAVPGLTGVVAGGAGEVALPLVVAHQPADGVDVGDAAPRADVLEGTGELAHARGGGRVPTRGGAHHEGGDAQTLEAVEDLGEVQARTGQGDPGLDVGAAHREHHPVVDGAVGAALLGEATLDVGVPALGQLR